MATYRRPSPTDTVGSRRADGHPHRNTPVRGIAPLPIPGYQDFFQRRFELAYSLLQRHSALASKRAIVALLLVLANLLALGLVLWLVFSLPAASGAFFGLLRLLFLLFLLIILAGLLVSLLLAVAAATWRPSSTNLAQPESAVFFQSGGIIFQDEAQFGKLFRETNQEQMLGGALVELYNQASFRHRQERWLNIATLIFSFALLGFGLAALIAFFL